MPAEKWKGDAAGLVSLVRLTDHQGNGFLMDKRRRMTYPMGVVRLVLAHQMRLRRRVMRARGGHHICKTRRRMT